MVYKVFLNLLLLGDPTLRQLFRQQKEGEILTELSQHCSLEDYLKEMGRKRTLALVPSHFRFASARIVMF